MIKLFRLDYRLLHGQVVFSWCGSQGIDYIVVADNVAANDKLKKTTLSLAKPPGTGLEILETKEAIRLINGGRYQRKTVLLICGNTKEALELSKNVDEIKKVNFGNIAKKENSKQYDLSVYLTDDELEDAKAILNSGVEVEMQQLPNSPCSLLKEKIN